MSCWARECNGVRILYSSTLYTDDASVSAAFFICYAHSLATRCTFHMHLDYINFFFTIEKNRHIVHKIHIEKYSGPSNFPPNSLHNGCRIHLFSLSIEWLSPKKMARLFQLFNCAICHSIEIAMGKLPHSLIYPTTDTDRSSGYSCVLKFLAVERTPRVTVEYFFYSSNKHILYIRQSQVDCIAPVPVSRAYIRLMWHFQDLTYFQITVLSCILNIFASHFADLIRPNNSIR